MNSVIYREHILDHYKNPQNFGIVECADIIYKESNPLCGDEIEISAKIENNTLADIKFRGHGCAISQAAASIMTENLKGKPMEEIMRFSREDMMNLLAIQISAMRMKCALLARHVLNKALLKNLNEKNNENHKRMKKELQNE